MTPSQPEPTAFGEALIAESKRRLSGESLPRIQKCVEQLTDEELWHRPNDAVVSVGNLVLHLCGNVRQWIISCLGGSEDARVSDEEFSPEGPIPREHLLAQLSDTLREAESVLDRMNPQTLLQPRRVQGQNETGLSILVHVVEHFSYHTGQISLHVKLRKGLDLGYYAGMDLNAKG